MTKEELKNVEVSIEVDTTTNIGELLDEDEIDAIYDSLGDNQEENFRADIKYSRQLPEMFMTNDINAQTENVTYSLLG